MKSFIKIFLTSVAVIAVLSCSEKQETEMRVSNVCNYDNRQVKQSVERIRGTIRLAHRNVPGEYVIIPEDENTLRYAPCNLPTALHEDGKRIIFSGEIKETYENESLNLTPFKLTQVYIVN